MRLRMSKLGDDFPPERFLRTPVSTIRMVLHELVQQEQAKANEDALVTARLTHLVLQVAHGFSGSNRPAPAVGVKDFLPYPDWRPSYASPVDQGPDQATKFILTELGRKHLIPIHVLAALMTSPDRRP
jgi:hypothetical protein